MNSKFAKFNIGLISKRWYLEDIQDRSVGFNFQDETIGIVTQFQQSNGNELVMATDLHVLNELRGPETFTFEVKQRVQRNVKYAYGFGKMKKALNLSLDLGCENELIGMINSFIDCKKDGIVNINEEMRIADPFVQKRRGRPPSKRIKSSSERTSHINTKNSAINPTDPNLFIRVSDQPSSLRIPFSVIEPSNIERTNNVEGCNSVGGNNNNEECNNVGRYVADENSCKRKYICKICGESGHNSRNKAKCSKQQ